jgi:hypothetical protein
LQICQRNNEGGWRIDHKPQLGSYITKQALWLSFNDIIDIEEKAAWILDQKLGGASVFMLNDDDWYNECGFGKFPLLTAINHAFGRLPESATPNMSCSLLNNRLERND